MDKKQAIFNENDIPYKELELIGISKKQIWSLDKANITALLSGKRTSLLDLSFHDNNGEEISMKGKISLYWKDSNNAGVKVHPVRPEIMNDINLKPKELERLQDNEIITKTINNEKYLVQLDPETNELLKTKIKSISIPSNIKGVELDKQQKETLKSGKELILNVDKEKIAIRLDLNNPRGIKFLDFEQKQKIAYDRHNPQIIGTIHTDKNRNEYIEYMKGQKTTLGNESFSKGNETYTYPLNTLKLGNLGDNRESLLEQSKERIISFFDKEQASNNFQEYSQYLRENHNVAIIKWDDIKQGTNKNEGYKDGFTVIDLENKIAYKGEDLYRYAYEQNQTLDGKGSYVDIDWNKFNEVGVKPENLSPEDIANIKNGKKTGMLNFSIEDTPGNRTLLDNEKVSYKTENGKLHFEGKATTLKYITAENTPENKSKLKTNEIDFKEEGKRIKIDGINARKLAIAAITVVYPIAGIAILLIPKRQEIKNDLSFTKDEIKALKADNVVVKTNSKGERTLHQRDKDTNEIVSIKAKDIHIPQKLGGIELTPMQQENLKNGKEITIVNEELNKAAKVKLDLNARNGLSIKDANTIEIKATEKKEQTIGKERYISDKERLEFVAQKGAKGIDEIFKDKPTEMAAFLEKHKLSKDYASYKEVEKTYSSSREATKQTVGEQISTQMDKIDSSIKATAKQEASILGYGRTYGKNNDTPTMKL